jgi:hypothetical protein
VSYNAARERILRALKQSRAKRVPIGQAWSEWEKWDVQQRRHILRVWCHLSKTQINFFCKVPWYSLNLHIRKSIKMFFRRSPTVDKVLWGMRYPPPIEGTITGRLDAERDPPIQNVRP